MLKAFSVGTVPNSQNESFDALQAVIWSVSTLTQQSGVTSPCRADLRAACFVVVENASSSVNPFFKKATPLTA